MIVQYTKTHSYAHGDFGTLAALASYFKHVCVVYIQESLSSVS